VTLSRLKVFE